MLKKTYSFVTSNRSFDNEVFLMDKHTYFYQICTYPDQTTGRYHMRRFLMDGNNFVKEVKYFYLTPQQKTVFYNTKQPNIYRSYAVYDFTDISIPTEEELDVTRSDLFDMKINSTNYYNV